LGIVGVETPDILVVGVDLGRVLRAALREHHHKLS